MVVGLVVLCVRQRRRVTVACDGVANSWNAQLQDSKTSLHEIFLPLQKGMT